MQIRGKAGQSGAKSLKTFDCKFSQTFRHVCQFLQAPLGFADPGPAKKISKYSNTFPIFWVNGKNTRKQQQIQAPGMDVQQLHQSYLGSAQWLYEATPLRPAAPEKEQQGTHSRQGVAQVR